MSSTVDAPARTRRAASASDTRRRIVRAAVELVQSVGWRDATVERIAARAGVAKGTFFVHFATKEALVETLVGIQTAGASRARQAAIDAGAPARERLRETVLTLGRLAGANVELSRAVLLAGLASREVAAAVDAKFFDLHQRIVGDAREAFARGELAGADPERLADLLMACYLGAALHCTTSPRARSFEEVLAPLVDATLAALAPRARARRRDTGATTKAPERRARRRKG